MKNKYTIGIDARTLYIKGGAKTYAENLLHSFDNKNKFILFGVKEHLEYKTLPTRLNQKNGLFRLIWENILLPLQINRNRIKLFHGLKGYVPIFGGYKKVVTVHDLSHFINPDLSNLVNRIYWRYISPYYIKRANHIITVSEATKRSLIKYLGINKNRITTIHLGYDKKKFTNKDKGSCLDNINLFLKKNKIKIKEPNKKDIILNVSTVCLRKNICNLIKAFNRVAAKNPRAVLLLAGRPGEGYEKIHKEYQRSSYKDRIYFLGFVPDEVVVSLYNIARVFAFPSFHEGFGLPILEAQACGCPVVTSNVTSMPEIAGESALLIDPYNVKEITKAITSVLNNNRLRLGLIDKGFKNIKRFSWEKCAGETLEVYQRLLNNE